MYKAPYLSLSLHYKEGLEDQKKHPYPLIPIILIRNNNRVQPRQWNRSLLPKPTCSFSQTPSFFLFKSLVDKQNEIETLKAENDRLKSSGNATPTATPIKTARPPSETSSTSSSSSRQSLGLSLNNLNITDTIMSGQFTVTSAVKCLTRSASAVGRFSFLFFLLFFFFCWARCEQEALARLKWLKQTWNESSSPAPASSSLLPRPHNIALSPRFQLLNRIRPTFQVPNKSVLTHSWNYVTVWLTFRRDRPRKQLPHAEKKRRKSLRVIAASAVAPLWSEF